VSELREKITKGPKKMIGNTGYRRYVTIEKEAIKIDEKKIASEKKFDGIYVLRTNTELSAKEAALAYKGQWQVERARSARSRAPSRSGRFTCRGRIGSRDISLSASWRSVSKWRSFAS
jgi:pyruvate dehydrogenase complex dehydrogenase (E1) component